ncbi:MAG: HD domain-containing protein [Treponema sp.]|jgi:poly(A) polymerase|nr:HD domain-containing protein [Treponema sp.]
MAQVCGAAAVITGTAPVYETLTGEGYAAGLLGFSAIDRYLGREPLPFALVETDAEIQDLARLFEGLRFPGPDLADGAVRHEGRDFYFYCTARRENSFNSFFIDDNPVRAAVFPLLEFSQDLRAMRFRDPRGVYPLLREIRSGSLSSPWWEDVNLGAGRYRALMAAALILARYGGAETPAGQIGRIAALFRGSGGTPPKPEEQRMVLSGILSSPHPGPGLELLRASGFIAEFWPELAAMDGVDHSKEFHPEGHVWNHTLETFRHRKPLPGDGYDLRLSLGLLLHDAGKPLSGSSGNRRFDGHAELGAWAARRFMERLEFDPALKADVFYLVKNHMLPAALKRLPLARTGEVMDSPLFPVLMELYRCDEASSFKGLDGYYENSAAYQTWLRNVRNPYRSADGKILGKRQRRS